MKTNKISNIEQERAESAFQKAYKSSKEYGSYVKKFPMYIKVNGFTNAVAFAYNKAFGGKKENKDWKKLYTDIADWLKKEPQHIISKKISDYKKEDNNALMDIIVNLETTELRLVTAEVLSFFNWLRRFVKDE